MNIVRSVYAEVRFNDPNVNPVAKFSSIASFTNIFVPLMMVVGGVITLTMLLYGAFTYLTSEGNADKLKKAQSIMLYAVLGLFIIAASYIFTNIIKGIVMPL